MGITGWVSIAPLMAAMAMVIVVGLLALCDGAEG